MRILIFANFGMGLYKFRKELLQRIVKDNNDVYVSFPQDEYVPLIESLGCKYIETKVDRRGTNPLTDLQLLKKYIYILKEIKPDIVLTYTVKPNIYGGIACRITKTSYIANITGLGTAIENKGVIKNLTLRLYNLGLKKARCVFFQNESNKKLFLDKKIITTKTRVIPGSGVNLEQYNYESYPDPSIPIRFLFIGRMMKAKGIDELLNAAKTVKKKYPNVEFDLVGFCEEEYLDKLNKLSDDGIITYYGQQDNVHEFIKNAFAIILPSYHEGTSNVLLESASKGRPILASRVTGCKETFDEGKSGLGFEVKSTSSLINTIIKFIELPYKEKKEMGIAGRKKMEEKYDREIVIDAYLEEISK